MFPTLWEAVLLGITFLKNTKFITFGTRRGNFDSLPQGHLGFFCVFYFTLDSELLQRLSLNQKLIFFIRGKDSGPWADRGNES